MSSTPRSSGVLLNRLLPELIIVIILIFVLGYNAYKTLVKARSRRDCAEIATLIEARGETACPAEL